MNQPVDWSDVHAQLTALQASVAAAHQAALDSIGGSDADGFIVALSQLGETLTRVQPVLAATLAIHTPPAEVILLTQQVGTGIDNLFALNTRLSVQAQRALDVLFPPDQVKVYSRLGARTQGLGGAGSGYIKA